MKIYLQKDNFDNSDLTIIDEKNNMDIFTKIKNSKFWPGDLEISEASELYKLNIIIYKIVKMYIFNELSFYNLR